MLQISRAKPEQADALTKIALAAKRHWGYPEHWIKSWRDLLTVTPEFVVDHETYTAVVNERTVGFYALGRKGNRADLVHMWVLPEMMGHGVGRALFLHCIERVKALGLTELEIESDANAEGFYQRMGAHRIEMRVRELDGQRRELPILIYTLPASGNASAR